MPPIALLHFLLLRNTIRHTLKAKITGLLQKPLLEAFEEVKDLPPKKAIVALLPRILSTKEEIKWRAITIAGKLIASLAETDMAAARIFIRRLIWNLTEESGGCPLGTPELIAEALANHKGLAEEYHSILISYIIPDANYLEFEPLQRGAIWGIGRVAQVYPEFMREAAPYLSVLLDSEDAYVRGFACWALSKLGKSSCIDYITKLKDDNTMIRIFDNYQLESVRISSLLSFS